MTNDREPANTANDGGLGRGESFKLLFDTLKGYQTGTLDSAYKTLGFMVVALGWLITSSAARDFLADNAIVREVSVGFLILSVIGYALMTYRVYALSQRVAHELGALAYAPDAIYSHLILRPTAMTVYVVIHTLISGLICVVILSAK